MSVITRSILLLILSAGFIGCTESQREEATGDASIQGINGLVDSFDVNFLIEERGLGVLAFKSATASTRFDDLNYTFNFDIAFTGVAGSERIASVLQDVAKDTDYLFAIGGSVAAPEVFVWQHPERDWAGTETVFENAFANLNSTIGTVDVYYAPTGTLPVIGNSLGSIGFGDRIDNIEFDGGEYELILTPPGDPSTILYSGLPLTGSNAQTVTTIIIEADPSITGDVSVRQLFANGSTLEIPDSRFPPTVQLVNAALDPLISSMDLVIDNDFVNPPTLSNIAFSTVSADADVPAGISTFTYTPPASMTVLLEQDTSTISGTRSTIFIYGEPGSLATSILPSDRRSIPTEVRIRFTNASFNAASVDIYLSAPGVIIDDIFPSVLSLTTGISTGYVPRVEDLYEVTVTVAGEKTVLAGPVSIDLANGDIEEVVVLDTVDPAVADILVFSNLPTP